jgi:hypothetical protein
MIDSEDMLRRICSAVYDEAFPYSPHSEAERSIDAKQVDNQLFELQTLALDLQRVVLDVRQKGATAEALRQRLYEVIR